MPTTPTATGLYFASINYTVHSIMYFYYFLSIAGGPLRAVARPIAPLITMVQLLQMVAGASITLLAALRHEDDPSSCEATLTRQGPSAHQPYPSQPRGSRG